MKFFESWSGSSCENTSHVIIEIQGHKNDNTMGEKKVVI